MGESSQSLEDQNADKNMGSKSQGQEVSVGNKDFIGNWSKGQAFDICQINYLNFAHVLSLCRRLRLREVKFLTYWEKFQGSPIIRLLHGHY